MATCRTSSAVTPNHSQTLWQRQAQIQAQMEAPARVTQFPWSAERMWLPPFLLTASDPLRSDNLWKRSCHPACVYCMPRGSRSCPELPSTAAPQTLMATVIGGDFSQVLVLGEMMSGDEDFCTLPCS